MHRGARYIYIYIHRLTDYVQTVLHLFKLSPSAQLRSRPFIILRTLPLAIVLLKLRYIQGVRLKSDVMRKLSESSRGGHGYGRRNSFLFRGERNERTAVFVETNEIFYYRREKGWPRGGARTAAQIARTISNAALPFEF